MKSSYDYTHTPRDSHSQTVTGTSEFAQVDLVATIRRDIASAISISRCAERFVLGRQPRTPSHVPVRISGN
jgi:hypothetical protein